MNKERNKNKRSLAETEAGKDWLKQFDAEDIETARLLLDSLVFISYEEFNKGMKHCIERFLETHEGNVALYVAREVPQEVKDYWEKQKENRVERILLRQLEESIGTRKPLKDESSKLGTEKAPTYFKDKRCRPKAIDVFSRDGIGSEGRLASLCRNLCAVNKRLLNHPSLSGVKKSRCSWILCVDDIIGSGRRMDEFVKWLNMHKTIKSKRSFGWLKFAVISYAACEKGLSVLKKHKIIEKIEHRTFVPSGRTFWTDIQRKKIIDICKKYGKLTSKVQFSCGYRKALTLTIFQHNCPNTTPAILWAPPSKNKKWISLFHEEPGLALEKWPKANKDHNQERILKSLGHTRLCKPGFFSHLNVESRQLLVLLASLAVKKRKVRILSDMLELPQDVVIDMITQCQSFGWIGSQWYLTDAGQKTLEAARRNHCFPGLDVEIKDDFYYPKALRSSASSFSSGSSEEELPWL